MQQKTLPRSWVDRLFARLQGVYGREFTGQFATGMVDGIDLGIENAKEVWAEELGGFADHPEALSYALKHLPEKCPNAIRFREICRHAPPSNVVALEHKISDEERERNKARFKDLVKVVEGKMTPDDFRAKNSIAKEES